jgi:hypothetical protein
MERKGKAWMARQGKARHGMARQGMESHACHGMVRQGKAWHGKERSDMEMNAMARLGMEKERHGKARQYKDK